MTTSKSFNVSKYFSENSPIDNIVTGIQPVGIQVYNTVDDLPLSGISAGSQAYVNENNRLYMFTGGGWFSIALINQNPAFDSGGTPDAGYALDSYNGSPTIIQLSASDPEEVPVQWSYVVSDSAQYFATIQQDSSVFTITTKPTSVIEQYDSDGGTFSITFKASDGVNLATALSEFTITFSAGSYVNPLSTNGSTVLKSQSDLIGSPTYSNVRGLGSDINGYVYAMAYTSPNVLYQIDINPMKTGGNALTLAQIEIPTIRTYDYFMGNCISIDGKYVYIADTGLTTGNIIRRYLLTTPYDITTLQPHDKQLTYTSSYTGVTSFICISSDGTIFYARRTGAIEKFILSTPWDISTATLSQSIATPQQDTMVIDPNGTRFICWRYNVGTVYEYTMSVPHDLSTATQTATTGFPLQQPSGWLALSGVYTTDGQYLFTHYQNGNVGELRQLA